MFTLFASCVVDIFSNRQRPEVIDAGAIDVFDHITDIVGRWPSARKKYPDRSATEGHKPGKRKPDKHVVSVHDRVLRNDIGSTANSVTSAAPMYYRDTRIRVLLLRANDLRFDAMVLPGKLISGLRATDRE